MLLYVHSSFAIILMGKRELVALLSLSSRCLVIVVWLFLAVPSVCLQFVIVAYPYHTHLLTFLKKIADNQKLMKITQHAKRLAYNLSNNYEKPSLNPFHAEAKNITTFSGKGILA